MDCSDCIVRFEDMEWTSPAEHVRQKARAFGSKRFRFVQFLRGLEHPEWCTKGHVGYMLEGSMKLELDSGTIEVFAGDGFILPTGDQYRHRPEVTSDRAVMLLIEDA